MSILFSFCCYPVLHYSHPSRVVLPVCPATQLVVYSYRHEQGGALRSQAQNLVALVSSLLFPERRLHPLTAEHNALVRTTASEVRRSSTVLSPRAPLASSRTSERANPAFASAPRPRSISSSTPRLRTRREDLEGLTGRANLWTRGGRIRLGAEVAVRTTISRSRSTLYPLPTRAAWTQAYSTRHSFTRQRYTHHPLFRLRSFGNTLPHPHTSPSLPPYLLATTRWSRLHRLCQPVPRRRGSRGVWGPVESL